MAKSKKDKGVKPFQPMLAATCEDPEKIVYPVWATPKYDGIRNLQMEALATSRSLKPIPNRHIQAVLGRPELNGLDGELITYTDGKMDAFSDVQSKVMSEDGEPDFIFHAFDTFEFPEWAYIDRVALLGRLVLPPTGRVKIVRPVCIGGRGQLADYVSEQLALGFEGTMIRNSHGPYKWGRATFREGYLTKIKPFEDDEAIVIGFEEQMENGNEATTNALGLTERSSHKANLIPKDTLGALIVLHPTFGEFNIGVFRGFKKEQLREVWQNRAAYLGRKAKFRYQKFGTKDKPRIPTLLAFRDERDL